ncbi:MAG: hypothetical protein HS108_05290 [Planctomycetes bacterium]|jgi:hypothetical protein|nr:hypothetical protein [Planctomycetota bacterium]MCL4730151.1 hypothetical protein [Planctomycetota bacterium]
MPVTAATARKLCSADELALYNAAALGRLKRASIAELKPLVARARRLRDKWKDELARQRREAKGRKPARGRNPAQSTRNTELKAELFAQTLKRLQDRLEQLARPKVEIHRGTRASGAPKWVRRGHVKGKGKQGNRKRNRPLAPDQHSPNPPAPDKSAKVARAGVKRTLAHMAARNRRTQARRDHRAP